MRKLIPAIALVAVIIIGCTTSQQRVAYNSLYTVETTTTATVDGYYLAAAKGIAPSNGVHQVSVAYNDFHVAFLVALDAAQYNTNALAPLALQQESADVIGLVGQFWKGK